MLPRWDDRWWHAWGAVLGPCTVLVDWRAADVLRPERGGTLCQGFAAASLRGQGGGRRRGKEMVTIDVHFMFLVVASFFFHVTL